jgi:hypothetical protein
MKFSDIDVTLTSVSFPHRIGWHGKQHHKSIRNNNAELSVELFFSFRSSKVRFSSSNLNLNSDHFFFCLLQVQNLVCEQSIRDLVTEFTDCPIVDVAFKTYIINTVSLCPSSFILYTKHDNLLFFPPLQITPLCFGSGFLHLPVTHEGVAAARLLSSKLHNVMLQDVCYDFKIAHSLTEVFAARPELNCEPSAEEQVVLASGKATGLRCALSYAMLSEMQHLIEPQNLQWSGASEHRSWDEVDRAGSGSGKSNGSGSGATSSDGGSLYSVHQQSPITTTTWQPHQAQVGWQPQETEFYAYPQPPPAQQQQQQQYYIQQQQPQHIQQPQLHVQQPPQSQQLYALQLEQLATRHQLEREAVQRAFDQHQRLLFEQQHMQRSHLPSQWQVDQEAAWRLANLSPHQAGHLAMMLPPPLAPQQYTPPPEYAPRPGGNLPTPHQLRHYQRPLVQRVDNINALCVPEQLQWAVTPVQQQQQPQPYGYHQYLPTSIAEAAHHFSESRNSQSPGSGHNSDSSGPHAVSASAGRVRGKDSRASRKGLFNNMRYNPRDQPGADRSEENSA